MDRRSSFGHRPVASGPASELDLLVHPRRIERLVRRVGVRDGESLLVVRFRELDESAGQRRLLEYPEPAIRRRIMGAQRLQSLGVVGAFGGRNGRALYR